MKYCQDIFSYQRFKSRTVNIGGIPMGYGHPIRLQSMTNTSTQDIQGTVEQTLRMVAAGADYVRITTPVSRDVEALAQIKKELRARGCQVPLIADIHFNPKVAEEAAKVCEKIRINPGNFADKKNFTKLEFTETDYAFELEKIHEKMLPILKACKENGTVIRIGTNHGSLSDRIMSKYGDTPLGMVEATMEFIRICEAENFNDLVISLKASNARVMVYAYRMMVSKMLDLGMNYPLHLGVTEAGEGEDGRIKSASGIGTLLADGIGDTVRVSLTEAPENEVPVAKSLVQLIQTKNTHELILEKPKFEDSKLYHPFEYCKRDSDAVTNIGGKFQPIVITDLHLLPTLSSKIYSKIGYKQNQETKEWKPTSMKPDFVFWDKTALPADFPKSQKVIVPQSLWLEVNKTFSESYPIFSLEEFSISSKKSKIVNFVRLEFPLIHDGLKKLTEFDKTIIFVIQTGNINPTGEARAIFYKLNELNINAPIVIQNTYNENIVSELQIHSASDFGPLFLDGLGDGIWIRNNSTSLELTEVNNIAFTILQASRTRVSKTEFISCPGCGRTLFDLQSTTAKVREKTSHLKNLKIAVMGCIVNGPGEMADADYGYVGTGTGIINLYKGKEIVKRNIPDANAVQELVNLIKDNGDWQEPE